MVTLCVAAGALALALEGGAADVTVRSVAAVLILWTGLLATAFGLWPVAPVPRAALVCGGLLAAFAAFTGLSVLWAPAAERAFAELDRVVLYVALFALPVLAASRGSARRWADGLALAIGVVAFLAVAQRLLPDALPAGDIPRLLPAAATRLSYPIGYWNGLAILLALGVPLLLRVAASDARLAVRALGAAPLPAVALAIYLSSSRGGVAAGAVGIVALVALAPRRLATLQALLVAGLGAAVAIAVVRSHPALVDGVPGAPAARDEGPGVAALLALVCGLTAAAQAAIGALAPARLALPRAAAAALAAAAVVAGVAGVAAAGPAERLREFKAPPELTVESSDFVDTHLASGAGSGRWQFWSAALDQFAEHPLAGEGAGTYEAWWARHGTVDWFARNAHSVWFETLGELGIVGLLLLAGAFAAALVTGAVRLRGRVDGDRSVVAALLAVVAAFAVGAGVDWVWQIPAVAAIGVVALGLLVGPASLRADGATTVRPLRAGGRVAIAIVAALAILAQAVPLLALNQVRASQDAVARGDLAAAEDRAAAARAIQPWAASPHLQLALVREQRGDLAAARRHLADAIERDRSDWRLRVVDARLATKAGDIRAARAALRTARRLNPRSPVLR
jgi:hypothetical protein